MNDALDEDGVRRVPVSDEELQRYREKGPEHHQLQGQPIQIAVKVLFSKQEFDQLRAEAEEERCKSIEELIRLRTLGGQSPAQ